MAGMSASGSAWFCVVVGVLLLVEAAVFFVGHRRPGSDAGRRGPRGQVPILALSGVMLISGNVTRLAGSSGAVSTVADLIGTVAAVSILIFAIRYLRALRRGARPSREDAQE
jgi:hypothetical protein